MLRFELATEKYTWLSRIGTVKGDLVAWAHGWDHFLFAPLTQDRLLRWDGNDEYVEYNLPENCKYHQYGPVNATIYFASLYCKDVGCRYDSV